MLGPFTPSIDFLGNSLFPASNTFLAASRASESEEIGQKTESSLRNGPSEVLVLRQIYMRIVLETGTSAKEFCS